MLLEEALDQKERRRSQRWSCAKTISWRIKGGRRVRKGLVPERSLDGLVIATAKKDAVPTGTFVLAGDDRTGFRHGFRNGVICRTVDLTEGTSLLFVEILA
jgi:hypothetical protein